MPMNPTEKITGQKKTTFAKGASDSEGNKQVFGDPLKDYNPRTAYMMLLTADEMNPIGTRSGIGPDALVTGNNQGIVTIGSDGEVLNGDGFDPNFPGAPTLEHFAPNVQSPGVGKFEPQSELGQFGEANDADLEDKLEDQLTLEKFIGGIPVEGAGSDQSNGLTQSPSNAVNKTSKLGDLLTDLSDLP